MALENTKAQYQIEITRTGAGAAQAVSEFQAVATAAKTANVAMATSAGVSIASMATLANTTKSVTAGFKAMQGTLTLVGLQTFPQTTIAAQTVQTAFHGVKAAAAAMGTTVAGAAGAFAVIGASIYEVIRALKEYSAMNKAFAQSDQSELDTRDSLRGNAEGMRKAIMNRVAQGRLNLSAEEADRLDRMLNRANADDLKRARQLVQGRMPVGEFMSESERNAAVREAIAGQNRSAAFSDASVALNNPRAAGNRAFQQLDIQQKYNDQVELFNRLREQGLVTETELRDMTIEADTRRMQNLVQLRSQLTDLQALQKRATEEFASGFSNAFVEFVSGTKSAGDAFKQFAAQFLKSVAQMIMEYLVLKALAGIGLAGDGGSFSSFRSAGSGGHMALGGIRFAAGGLEGVHSVSSPTYFPSFNVLAGEAGREMLTVLARPRLMEIGGMEAVVGNAGNNRLAITNADDLAQRGAGGRIVIEVRGTRDFEARVIENSVQGARVQVANDLRRDTPISQAVKGLSS